MVRRKSIPKTVREEFDKWESNEISGQQFRDLGKKVGKDEWDILIYWCWYRMEKINEEKAIEKEKE